MSVAPSLRPGMLPGSPSSGRMSYFESVLGDQWWFFVDGDGEGWISGSDIGWEDRHAKGHGLVLDRGERAWVAACLLGMQE